MPSDIDFEMAQNLDRLAKGRIVATHLVQWLGLDLEDKEFQDTPRRVAEWFMGFQRKPDYDNDLEDFFSVDFHSQHQEMIMTSGLHFVSLCPHHLLPYAGEAAIGYIPGPVKPLNDISRLTGDPKQQGPFRVVGLSKLARGLWYYTHWPVKQEDSTAMLADAIMKYLGAKGCMVVLKAHHACMAYRGVMQQDHMTTTSAVRGVFFSDGGGGAKDEFLRLWTT